MKSRTYVGLPTTVLAFVILSGCISTSFRSDPSRTQSLFPAVSPSDVRVLRSLPDQGFQRLGYIDASLSGHHSSEAVLRKVRKAAADVGANAVVCEASGTLFAEPGRIEMQTATPEAVSYTFTAIRLADR